jgi:release factor glutamine methyltransferase
MEWDGLFLALHPEVYRPAEDTFLLARAVAAEIRRGDRFLEAGCGAGLVSLVAARAGATATATDLNAHAVALCRHNARENGLDVEAIECDLVPDGAPGFDVVAFNPPYLPTAPDEVVPGPLNLAFDGGLDGNGTVLRFAAKLGDLAGTPRVVLVVHSTLSDPNPLDAAMAGLGYVVTESLRQTLPFEVLTVRRYARP